MQPTKQPLSVPRRTLDVEDYIDIIRRYKVWILGPAFAGLVISVVVAFLWPDTYLSAAILKVEPQKVPEKFVQSNVNMAMSTRIQAMAMEILSRPMLISVIQKHNLYPRERKSMPMEDVVELMRNRDIGINVVTNQLRGSEQFPSFRISFRYENRYVAQKVCADFVTKFIDENIRTRTDQSVATTGFLKDQFDLAKKELEEIEARILQFRVANQGRLPEQLQGNLQQLSALEARVNILQNGLSRASQEKLLLEARLRSLKEQMTTASAPPPPSDPAKPAAAAAAVNEKLAQLDREIERAETTLSAIRERYTANHPDVRQFEQNIDWLRKQREVVKQDQAAKELAAKEPKMTDKPKSDPQGPPGPVLMSPAMQRQIQELQGAIDQIELAIRAREMDNDRAVAELKASAVQMKALEARIEASPMNEPVYQQMLRDRDVARDKYSGAQRSKSQSETATLIEDRKQGENLELLEQPTLPMVPAYPNRWMIVGSGSLLGLLAGLFLAGAKEVKDTSLKNLKDVRAYTQLTVLGSIPLLENDFVARRQRRILVLAWSTAVFFGIVIMFSSVYYYYSITRV